jgi:CRISPR-associated endonuclease/helicase Cas3
MTHYAHTLEDYAHTLEGRPSNEWEPLFTPLGSASDECQFESCEKCANLTPYHGHLNKVSWWTAKFAREMFARDSINAQSIHEWGYLAGLWHDLGKFALEWQIYLRNKAGYDLESDENSGTVDHSTAGALYAVNAHPLLGHFFAYIISGHHGGLADAISEHSCLQRRLLKEVAEISDASKDSLRRSIPNPPPFLFDPRSPHKTAFFTRMLFSCLVDADFLATESFMSPERSAERTASRTELLGEMHNLLTAHVASFGPPLTCVDQARHDVYRHCLLAAEQEPGLFSLTVPTGGGKTLSSLAFALKHAITHGQKRVIYVIPFTSIIEQNAEVFARIFAPLGERWKDPVVVEHHSNLSPEKETTGSRLAAENWDAFLIVTTAVQFYESLHAARTSNCRKLHNIANSVVILDEAQCLPVDYLQPCLDTLRELAANYHTTVVLCTATQPAIHRSESFPIGLENVREIMPDPLQLFKDLKRVEIINRDALTDSALANEMASLTQCLAIVNTRRHARSLFQLLPASDENFHLSALMCPAHRRSILAKARMRLDQNQPIRLISTQLIEAGIDIDFSQVYRSLAGIDSIAQAAGRCNRHGRQSTLGQTHVFRSEHQRAEAYFRDTAQIAAQIIELHDDPLSLESVERFFSLYYHQHNPPNGRRWDTKDIQSDYKLTQNRALPLHFQFRTVAEKFRLIENDQTPVLIPYDNEAKKLLDDLRRDSIPLHRDLFRRLQPYTVQIRSREFHENRVQFESVRDDQFHILICPETHYSEQFGLNLETDNTTTLIC